MMARDAHKWETESGDLEMSSSNLPNGILMKSLRMKWWLYKLLNLNSEEKNNTFLKTDTKINIIFPSITICSHAHNSSSTTIHVFTFTTSANRNPLADSRIWFRWMSKIIVLPPCLDSCWAIHKSTSSSFAGILARAAVSSNFLLLKQILTLAGKVFVFKILVENFSKSAKHLRLEGQF